MASLATLTTAGALHLEETFGALTSPLPPMELRGKELHEWSAAMPLVDHELVQSWFVLSRASQNIKDRVDFLKKALA